MRKSMTPAEKRKIIHSKFDGKCAYCGIPIQIKDMQVDHIISKYNFKMCLIHNWKIPEFLRHLTINDLDSIDNLFPACRVCNGWKSTYHLELFRSEIQEQVKRLNERHANYRMAKKYGLIQEVERPVVFYFETLYELKQMKS